MYFAPYGATAGAVIGAIYAIVAMKRGNQTSICVTFM